MRLKLILPYKTILDREVEKITAPGSNGEFQILPKHIDGTWTLNSGILTIFTDKKIYYAIDTGVVVKKGDIVYLSTFQAVSGESLQTLSHNVRENLQVLNEREKQAYSLLLKLEADTIKKFMEIDL